MNYRSFLLPALLLAVAVQLLRAANEQYEPIRDNYGIEAVLGIAGLALVLFLMALTLVSRAVSNHRSRDQLARQAPQNGQAVGTLVGLSFGAITCLAFFLAGTVVFIETETADTVFALSTRLGGILATAWLLSGITALIRPGRGFGRVFLYFIVGFAVTFAIYKALDVSLYEWPGLMDYIGWIG
jgi:hypothetical protein